MTRPRTWVIGEQEAGIRLGELLARIAPDAREALERGGVFVAGRRVRDATRRLRAGENLEVLAPRVDPDGVQILDEHMGLVAVSKPAGLPTEPDRRGSACAVSAAAEALRVPAASLHALGRLDAGVSGVVLLARDSAARRRALGARSAGTLRKHYLGIASGAAPSEGSGTWSSPVAGRAAETRWRAQAKSELTRIKASLLCLEPVTGRKHQLRAHCAAAGLPLYGDRRYGGPTRITRADGCVEPVDRVALHAFRLELEDWRVEAPLPDDLKRLLAALGMA
jgi:23S rRNA-/tRNA-specific pseudouridylate synthase